MLPGASVARVAIAWLHIVREHPVFLANYESLFSPVSSVRMLGQQCLRALRNGVGWCWQLGGALRSDGRPWFGSQDLPDQIDVLFVSHLVNTSHAGQAVDFYYGDVPNELAARGCAVAIALLNHSNQADDVLVGKWKNSRVPRVLLSRALGMAGEISIFRRLKNEALQLRKLAIQEAPGLFRSVLLRASQEALSGGSRTALRIGEQIRALVAKHKPKAIVVTHEGHAWERVAFAAARSAFPSIQCIGYQHAALFRLQHAIRRNLAIEYNPDQIQTAGMISKKQLEHAPSLEGIPISVLGSNRSFRPPVNSGRPAPNQERPSCAENPACLVLPEGIASECHLLFEFSLECAQVSPDILFIWRLHPIISFASLVAQNPKLRNLPGNIVLSHAGLEEDLARSRWTLYRGSTAIVQAVVAGLRPIYLKLPGELTIDPLYELEDWRMTITNADEFELVIRPDVERQDFPQEPDIAYAREYCESFFTPFDVGAMAAMIPARFKLLDLQAARR